MTMNSATSVKMLTIPNEPRAVQASWQERPRICDWVEEQKAAQGNKAICSLRHPEKTHNIVGVIIIPLTAIKTEPSSSIEIA